MFWTTNLLLALVALGLDAAIGYPDIVYRAIGHPVTWMGAALAKCDAAFNRDRFAPHWRRLLGAGAIGACLVLFVPAAAALDWRLRANDFGLLLLAALFASLPAQRSLQDHVAAVARALEDGALEDARLALAKIVGRDVAALDAAGVVRAAIESLAENFSDGVAAPALWLVAGGLAGGVFYKLVNTADSMIGHRTPRHESFGWAAARLDDLINLPASRASAGWLIAAAAATPGASAGMAWASLRRDAPRHRSPNAGWPEAAMAGALDLSLAGPRRYGGVEVDDAYMGAGRREANVSDLRAALRLYRRACLALWATFALLLALIGRA